MALYLSKLNNVDLRGGGSGNLGASNATMLMGKKAGIVTFVHDVLKIVIAALLCGVIFQRLQYALVVSAVAGVLGHMYPFYIKFKGGKGFASFIGMAITLDWKFGLLMLLCVVVISFLFDWVVAGTFFHIVLTPLHFCFANDYVVCLIIACASVCIFCKHIENIKRMRAGRESRLRSVLFKKK